MVSGQLALNSKEVNIEELQNLLLGEAETLRQKGSGKGPGCSILLNCDGMKLSLDYLWVGKSFSFLKFLKFLIFIILIQGHAH